MAKTSVALFVVGEDGQEVPLKNPLPGVRIDRGSGRMLRVENRTTEPIQVNGGRRPLRPGHHTVVHHPAHILADGKSIIAKVR